MEKARQVCNKIRHNELYYYGRSAKFPLRDSIMKLDITPSCENNCSKQRIGVKTAYCVVNVPINYVNLKRTDNTVYSYII